MKKVFLLILSFVFSFTILMAQCNCQNEEDQSIIFKDINGKEIFSLCYSFDGLVNKDTFSGNSLSLTECSSGKNLFEFSGEDQFKIEKWDNYILITRYKKLLANETLELIHIPLVTYKIAPNKNGSFDVFTIRVISIPTMDRERWENIFEEAVEKIEQKDFDQKVMAEILFSALWGIDEAKNLFFSLNEMIENEPLKQYYEELLETYEVYNHISKKGKKIFKGSALKTTAHNNS